MEVDSSDEDPDEFHYEMELTEQRLYIQPYSQTVFQSIIYPANNFVGHLSSLKFSQSFNQPKIQSFISQANIQSVNYSNSV